MLYFLGVTINFVLCFSRMPANMKMAPIIRRAYSYSYDGPRLNGSTSIPMLTRYAPLIRKMFGAKIRIAAIALIPPPIANSDPSPNNPAKGVFEIVFAAIKLPPKIIIPRTNRAKRILGIDETKYHTKSSDDDIITIPSMGILEKTTINTNNTPANISPNICLSSFLNFKGSVYLIILLIVDYYLSVVNFKKHFFIETLDIESSLNK
ncbi:MAG: hypothetical protein US79_C0002G0030 [Parcubacteria group bacterium GW2011_GWC1_38_17]|nr:MAG: hypothetical protein US79_C0002G0030 [Parcubacteria group bacterium GW2011_GWC1_38_17]